MKLFLEGFVKEAMNECGASVIPLDIPSEYLSQYGCVCVMNPSVYNDNGVIKCIARGVNYYLQASNKFPCWSGRLQYLHTEDCVLLKTQNFLLTFNDDLSDYSVKHIDMLELHEPIWEFWGLEDARLVRWEGKLYGCGVRRDTTDNGTGRMELSELEEREDCVVEVSRTRIPAVDEENSYCEKNWVPILDSKDPYTFLRWISPTEIVRYKFEDNTLDCQINGISRCPTEKSLRGGSQVVRFGDYNICIGHTVIMIDNPYSDTEAYYDLNFAIFDTDMNLIKVTNDFKFFDNPIEFCNGLCRYGEEDLIAAIGYGDNSSYLVRFNGNWLINKILNE